MPQQVLDDPKLNEALDILDRSAKDKREQLQQLISDKYTNIREAMGSTSSQATSIVRRNPWYFLGGVAAGFLGIGYLIGRSSK